MKKINLRALAWAVCNATIAFVAILLFSWKAPGNDQDKSLASVNKENGIYIFIECRPMGNYEVLGTVKKGGLVMNGKAREMVRIITRRAVKEYSSCEGVIFDDLGLDEAKVIKFK